MKISEGGSYAQRAGTSKFDFAEHMLIDAEHIEAMRLAFHKACAILQLSDEDDAFTELVAEKIIEVAKTGESDPERLCTQALDGLSERRAS
jgi:hypothetical protein